MCGIIGQEPIPNVYLAQVFFIGVLKTCMVAEPVSGSARLPNSPFLAFILEAMAHLRGSATNLGGDAAETVGMLGPGAMIAAVAASPAIEHAVPAAAAELQRMCPSRAKKLEEMKIHKDPNSDSPLPGEQLRRQQQPRRGLHDYYYEP